MVKYTLKRLLMAVVTLWVIITMTFVLMHAIPGNPFADEKRIQPEIMANLNAKYGLDKPLIEQYGIYMSNLVRGDFGVSLKYQNRTVNSLIAQGFPVSMTLGAAACLIGIGIGILFGIIAGINRGKAAGLCGYHPVYPRRLGAFLLCLPAFFNTSLAPSCSGLLWRAGVRRSS